MNVSFKVKKMGKIKPWYLSLKSTYFLIFRKLWKTFQDLAQSAVEPYQGR